jgi:hypothetical protein
MQLVKKSKDYSIFWDGKRYVKQANAAPKVAAPRPAKKAEESKADPEPKADAPKKADAK